MKKSRLLGVVCAFASAIGSMTSSAASISDFNDPSLAGGVLINFNQFTTNEYLNDFTVGTVSFIDTIQVGGNYFAQDAFVHGQSGRVIALYGEALIEFSVPVSTFAFSLSALNASWVIRATGLDGSLIEQLDIINPTCCATNIYGISSQGIFQIRLSSGTSGINLDAILMDDFIYTAVPIPSAIWLFASGLPGLFGMSRHKKTT
jgi:hypothetical protein